MQISMCLTESIEKVRLTSHDGNSRFLSAILRGRQQTFGAVVQLDTDAWIWKYPQMVLQHEVLSLQLQNLGGGNRISAIRRLDISHPLV